MHSRPARTRELVLTSPALPAARRSLSCYFQTRRATRACRPHRGPLCAAVTAAALVLAALAAAALAAAVLCRPSLGTPSCCRRHHRTPQRRCAQLPPQPLPPPPPPPSPLPPLPPPLSPPPPSSPPFQSPSPSSPPSLLPLSLRRQAASPPALRLGCCTRRTSAAQGSESNTCEERFPRPRKSPGQPQPRTFTPGAVSGDVRGTFPSPSSSSPPEALPL